MKSIRGYQIVVLILVGIVASSGLNAVNRIAIKAIASEEYSDARAQVGDNEIQTYHFLKGKFNPGKRLDPSMEEITFMDIVTDMAEHLKKQKFFPGKDPAQSDLVLVVHYGRTDADDSIDDFLGYTSLEEYGYTPEVAGAGAGGAQMTGSEMNAIADFGFATGASAENVAGQEGISYYRARLLGMEEAYVGEASPYEEGMLKNMLLDDRYYVVLIAYDLQLMRKGETVPLWSTRYSIRAIGQSFPDAIKDLNFAAGDYFGKNVKGLTQKRADDKSSINLGDIEVVDTEEEE